jgi:hypothetical protein
MNLMTEAAIVGRGVEGVAEEEDEEASSTVATGHAILGGEDVGGGEAEEESNDGILKLVLSVCYDLHILR